MNVKIKLSKGCHERLEAQNSVTLKGEANTNKMLERQLRQGARHRQSLVDMSVRLYKIGTVVECPKIGGCKK